MVIMDAESSVEPKAKDIYRSSTAGIVKVMDCTQASQHLPCEAISIAHSLLSSMNISDWWQEQ